MPQAKAAWGKPHAPLPGLGRMCIPGQHQGNHCPNKGLVRSETMTERVCPYLCAVDDQSLYFPTPHDANRCCALSRGRPARISPNFQERTCLTGRFGLCSRYKAASQAGSRPQARRLLLVGGGLATLVVLAGCAFLAILALVLGGVGATQLGFVARATDTPQPTATPSPTWTPTTSATPTEQPTNTATATPEPVLPTASVSPVISSGDGFVSPLATPTLWPTATQPQPAATRPLPTATRRPFPTATRPLAPTATRGPTLTPSVTSTPTATATPLVSCRAGDTITFNPANPTVGETLIIEVRSFTGYTDVSLSGGSSPRFSSVSREGSYYLWKWQDSLEAVGTYTYSFKIASGALTCATKTVTVSAPTATPEPVYGVELTLAGDDFRPIFTNAQPVVFALNLTNSGSVTDSFQVSLDAGPPQGWTAQYCIGDSCSDHTVPSTQVTLPQGGSQALAIKLIAAPDAQGGYALSVTLWVQSLGDPTKKKSQSVTVVVTQPASP
jgi:hypothetical protein